MIKWDELNLTEKVSQILQDVPDASDHHLGYPFLTAYQIAIEFAHRFPEDFAKLAMPIGGQGIGQRTSLSQYLAGQLSRRIKNGEVKNIEGGFLSNQNLCDINFHNGEEILHSSLTESGYPLSMFRYIK